MTVPDEIQPRRVDALGASATAGVDGTVGMSAVDDARDAERSRIAQELHDDIGQLLTALRTELLAAQEASGGAGSEVSYRLRESVRLAGAAISSLRRLSAGLDPPLHGENSLPGVIGTLAEEFALRTSVTCAVTAGTEPPDTDPDHRLDLVRITQEALANIERHARARTVTVAVFPDAETWLVVTDDGTGTGRDYDGTGTRNMDRRARRIGGSLTIGPTAGGGTTVTVWRETRPGTVTD